MRKNSKKLVLPAIAAAGAVMGAYHMASADYVITESAAVVSGSFDIYTLSVINNGLNSSGTQISGADVTISMVTAGQYLKADISQDLDGDGHNDANLTGNLNSGSFDTATSSTISSDPFATVKGSFMRVSGAALTADFENTTKDTTSLWSTVKQGGTLPSVFSSLSSLEVVVANTGTAAADTKATTFVNIVVPLGDKFTVTGSVGGPKVGGGSFSTNFATGNGSAGGSNPIVVLASSAPGNVGSQLGGTYTPATSPTLTVFKSGPGSYTPGLITGLSTQVGNTPLAGFVGTDVEKFLLKLSSASADAALVADINAGGNTTVVASLASADSTLATYDGITWDIELTSTGTGPENGDFGFNFSGDTNANGINVVDVAAVPEPATAGLLLVGGLGLLARRRRSAEQA
jgi:hypothetical protein